MGASAEKSRENTREVSGNFTVPGEWSPFMGTIVLPMFETIKRRYQQRLVVL